MNGVCMKLRLILILNLISTLAFAANSGEKSVDEIQWAPTGLRPLMLDNNISEKFCSYDSNRFKGCVAAVEKFATFVYRSTEITIRDGKLALQNDTTTELPFKQRQAHRRQKLNQIESAFSPALVQSLVELYQQLRTQKPNPKPHEIALPLNEFLAIAYDPHMMYQPMFKYDGLNHISQKPFIGMITEKVDQSMVVENVIVNSPAEKAGIKPGDEIVKANDQNIVVTTEAELHTVLNFQPNEKVQLTIRRQDKVFQVEVTFGYHRRSPVVDRVITHKGKKYSYLYMAEVPSDLDPESTCKVFSDIFKKMDKNSAGLVLDLRGNVGGPGVTAACLVGLLVGKNKTIYIDQDMVLKDVSHNIVSTLDKAFTKKIVVLVNEKTVSSGELMTSGIQFYSRGLVIGNRTFGKSIGQMIEPFEADKIDFYTTTSKAYNPDGTSYHGKGITPDFFVFQNGLTPSRKELNASREEDIALFPLKLEPIKAVAKRSQPLKFPATCATESSVRNQLNKLHDLDWQKDFQLQFALRTLECM